MPPQSGKRESLDKAVPTPSDLSHPMVALYSTILGNVSDSIRNNAMKKKRRFFLGPKTETETNHSRNSKLLELVTAKFNQLNTQETARTGNENAFLKVMLLELSGGIANPLDDIVLCWTAFLEVVCTTVKESKGALCADKYKSVLYELALFFWRLSFAKAMLH